MLSASLETGKHANKKCSLTTLKWFLIRFQVRRTVFGPCWLILLMSLWHQEGALNSEGGTVRGLPCCHISHGKWMYNLVLWIHDMVWCHGRSCDSKWSGFGLCRFSRRGPTINNSCLMTSHELKCSYRSSASDSLADALWHWRLSGGGNKGRKFYVFVLYSIKSRLNMVRKCLYSSFRQHSKFIGIVEGLKQPLANTASAAPFVRTLT